MSKLLVFDLYSKNITADYRRHWVRSGKTTSVILAGLSLRGNQAMRSFLEAIWKHSENLPPQTSPNHLCALQVGAKPPEK